LKHGLIFLVGKFEDKEVITKRKDPIKLSKTFDSLGLTNPLKAGYKKTFAASANTKKTGMTKFYLKLRDD
jgi:hypothetical protein